MQPKEAVLRGMAKRVEKFRIVPFTNPSGAVVHRVYGKLDGRIIRENYKDYVTALARKQELEIQAINAPLVLTMQPTRLTVGQLRDAEAAFQRLNGSPHTLLESVDFFLRNWRPAPLERTVEDAFDEFIQEKSRQNLRDRTLDDLRFRVGKFALGHSGKKV